MGTMDFHALIPDLRPNLGIESYIYEWVPIHHILAASALIWPEFLMVDDLVILESSRISLPHWQHRIQIDPTGVERVLNHRHLLDLFMDAPHPGRNHAQVLGLGRLLKETWTAKLYRNFPTRSFTVHFPEKFNLETDNPSISFCQNRPATPEVGDQKQSSDSAQER